MKKFNKEWNQSVKLFEALIASNSFHINLKHPISKNECDPHEALPEIVETWQETKSLWDRRSLMLRVIFNLVSQHLAPWQVANYLIASRQPLEAFEILQSSTSTDLKEEHHQHFASLAKAFSSLAYYEDSLVWAIKAYQASPNNSQLEIIMADAYYLVGHFDKANQIYQSYLSQVNASTSNSVHEMFLEIFSVENGLIPSPVFAIQFGQLLTDKSQLSEFWSLAEVEFYYSPYFRAHHSYDLANNGKIEESLAKLAALVQEMPWLKEASLNLTKLFHHFNKQGHKVMPDFQDELSNTILERGW